MASNSERYFPNPYLDQEDLNCNLEDSSFNIDFWLQYIKETSHLCIEKMKPKSTEKYCDGSIYVGSCGLIFMAYKIIKSGLFPDYEQRLKTYVRDCIKANEDYYFSNELRSTREVAFILGKGGFLVMASLAYSVLGDHDKCLSYANEYAILWSLCKPIDFLKKGSDELFVGRAGYLCGLLFLKKYLNLEPLGKNEIFIIFDTIIKSGRGYSFRHGCPSPLMYAYHGSEYLGNAHGLSGILQIVLSFPEYLNQFPDLDIDVKRAVDFLITIQKPNGNFPAAMDEVTHSMPRNEHKDLVHWCHGAGGVIFTMAKAYLRWKDEKYLDCCIKCGELIWQRGLLRKGPGICHGVAGGGLAHLLLYRLTNNKKYLYRARKFAEFTQTNQFKSEARTPDSPFSLFEGLAGTVCFILDLLSPQESEYPLVPVFYNY